MSILTIAAEAPQDLDRRLLVVFVLVREHVFREDIIVILETTQSATVQGLSIVFVVVDGLLLDAGLLGWSLGDTPVGNGWLTLARTHTIFQV
jgi:hypothetical protein